jgi:transcription termination factor NusB
MIKLIKKNKNKRKILFQIFYSLELNDNINHSELKNLILNKKYSLIYIKNKIKRILLKMTIINIILINNMIRNIKINDIDNIILKIAIFDIFFEKNIKVTRILKESLDLSRKFSDRKSFFSVKKIINNILVKF